MNGAAGLTPRDGCGVIDLEAPERMSQIPDHAPRSVSIENQFPEDLYDAMREFVRAHPQWDQYRLMQSALAGFLFQQGCQNRAVARHYLDSMFNRGLGAPATEPTTSTSAAPAIR